MASLPKTVKAWFPANARNPQATGLFSRVPVGKLENWDQYHHLLASRVQWMLENSPKEDFHRAADLLAPLFGERPWTPAELLDKIRWGLLQERLSLLGVDPPTRGRHEAPEWLMEVGPVEWASSLFENEPADELPRKRRKPTSKRTTSLQAPGSRSVH